MHFFPFSPYAESRFRCAFQHLRLDQTSAAGLPEEAMLFFAIGADDGPLTGATFPTEGPISFETYCQTMGVPEDQTALTRTGYRLLMYLRGFEVEPSAGEPAWTANWHEQAPLPWAI